MVGVDDTILQLNGPVTDINVLKETDCQTLKGSITSHPHPARHSISLLSIQLHHLLRKVHQLNVVFFHSKVLNKLDIMAAIKYILSFVLVALLASTLVTAAPRVSIDSITDDTNTDESGVSNGQSEGTRTWLARY
jgi:hypothetical protein